MDIDKKTAYIALESQEIVKADDLRKRQILLNEELSKEIDKADNPAKIFELKKELEQIPIKILTAEIVETRQTLKSLEDSLEQNKENIFMIEQIRVTRKVELEKQLDIFKQFEERYNKANFELSVAKVNEETIKDSRRDLRKKLEQLTEQLRNKN